MAADQIDIRSGGAVAVDTESLRTVAARDDAISDDLVNVELMAGQVRNALSDSFHTWEPRGAAEAVRKQAEQARERAAELALALRTAAAGYDIVDLDAQMQMAAIAKDAAAMVRINTQLRELKRQYPGAQEAALEEAQRQQRDWDDQIRWQAWVGSIVFSPLFPIVRDYTALSQDLGRGTIDRGERLRPSSTPIDVSVTSVVPSKRSGRAPLTLAEASTRIPSNGQIRVEKYTMPGGAAQFVVYLDGTRSLDAQEPWNLESNKQLYFGQRSASYEATMKAVRMAGVGSNDTVDLVAYSQGAMIAERIALEGELSVRTLISFGPPVQADVGPDITSIALRHSDDPVAALAGGGFTQQVGSSQSFVVERVADPAVGTQDLKMQAHSLQEYTETAAMVDSSADPRVQPVRDLFAELGHAERLQVSEYSATRIVPQSTPTPTPGPSPTPTP